MAERRKQKAAEHKADADEPRSAKAVDAEQQERDRERGAVKIAAPHVGAAGGRRTPDGEAQVRFHAQGSGHVAEMDFGQALEIAFHVLADVSKLGGGQPVVETFGPVKVGPIRGKLQVSLQLMPE